VPTLIEAIESVRSIKRSLQHPVIAYEKWSRESSRRNSARVQRAEHASGMRSQRDDRSTSAKICRADSGSGFDLRENPSSYSQSCFAVYIAI